jgi:hypothetical protein
MKREKINYSDFVRQISKTTGYAQKDITVVLDSAADIALQNLNNKMETAVMRGMIVYPSSYKGEINVPRARFGQKFKIGMNAPIS